MTQPAPSEVLHQPTGPAAQLCLLFHGVDGLPRDMAKLGQQLAQAFPLACVVAVQAPEVCDRGQGRGFQWYSVRGLGAEGLLERLTPALPRFEETVRHWQRLSGVPPAATALVGFSQGGIMSLAASEGARRRGELLAGRLIGMSCRLPVLPEAADPAITYHLIHGRDDEVFPYGLVVEAAEYLVALGADVTADVLPGVGHRLTQECIDLLLQRLQTHVPRRMWQEAMASAPR